MVQKKLLGLLISISTILLISTSSVHARPFHSASTTLVHEILLSTETTFFSFSDMSESDFELTWQGKAIPDVKFRLGQGTLQWTRVEDVLVLPRALLFVEANSLEGGEINNGAYSQNFKMGDGKGKSEIPIALLSGEQNPIRISVRRQGLLIQGELRVRYRPRAENPSQEKHRLYLDPSCSSFGVNAESLKLSSGNHDWLYIGCHFYPVQQEGTQSSSLELWVYWDNVGPSIDIENLAVERISKESLWIRRFQADPGSVVLKGNEHSVRIDYKIPKIIKRGTLKMGLGPYYYTFSGNNGSNTTNHPTLIPTIYTSYTITDEVRLAVFGEVAPSSQMFSDVGAYIVLSQFKFLDRRLVASLLLGTRAIGYYYPDRFNVMMTFPQGFSMSFNDFFGKAKTFTVGGYLFPTIEGTSFQSVWVRWGSHWFIEMNYHYWQSILNSAVVNSSNVGVSLIIPLADF